MSTYDDKDDMDEVLSQLSEYNYPGYSNSYLTGLGSLNKTYPTTNPLISGDYNADIKVDIKTDLKMDDNTKDVLIFGTVMAGIVSGLYLLLKK